MRKRLDLRTYIQVFAVLLALMTIPKNSSLRMKWMTVAALAPVGEQIQNIKNSFTHMSDVKLVDENGNESYAKEEIQRLKLENLLLSNEVQYLKEILQNETLIEKQKIEIAQENFHHLKRLRKENFKTLLSNQIQSIPARVIYRSPSSWTNTLWINVGANDNKSFNQELIAKNSPVVIGTSVVGVVDYVGNRQSRVRLITDSGLNPSVRVMRIDKDKTLYLAKGELRGSTKAEWRGLSTILKGIGFNYDFEDEEGPPRDLRTGEILGNSQSKIAVIQNGDLLITTGMDGVFPRGLSVAKVSHVNLLKEGDYYYEIEAKSCIENFDDLTTLFVLPPIGYNLN